MKCYILTYDFMNKNNIARTYYRFFYDRTVASKTFFKLSRKAGCVEISLKECELVDERVLFKKYKATDGHVIYETSNCVINVRD